MFRRPQWSMKNIAGAVVGTKMTYWIELDTRIAFPVRPAILNTYTTIISEETGEMNHNTSLRWCR